MDVFVDDQKVEFECEPTESLEDAVRRIQAVACPSGRVIASVRCDGIALAGDELIGAMSRPASDYGCIEVASATPRRLVTEAVGEASRMLADVDRKRERCADLLSRGDIQDGIAALSECLAVWQQIHEAVANSINMLGVDMPGVRVDGEPLEVALAMPKDRLEMVRDALKDQDFVLLADVLQYEFAEVGARWQALLSTVARLADGAPPSDGV